MRDRVAIKKPWCWRALLYLPISDVESVAKLLTKDRRRIAANVAKLPELLYKS